VILSKTPFRMSFVGGGSDMRSFYQDELGAVISTSINKYMYIAVHKKFDGRIRLSYAQTEEVDFIDQIKHPLVRECLKKVGIAGGVEIASLADIPSLGSGLGSSSSYTVGLLNALNAYKGQYISKYELAKQACEIEIEKCNEPIGKQDQFAASYGGLNLIRFHANEEVSVDPIICKPEILYQLEKSTLMFFTGRTRSASQLLAKQSDALLTMSQKSLVSKMVNLVFDMKYELESGLLDNIGKILNENWRLKSQIVEGISDPQIEEWYQAGLRHGAQGGKLLGAGNGGFLMFFAPPETHEEIKRVLSSLIFVDIGFDSSGSQVIFYQP
jgi:D-glycero-alpha-D-manno-heptose-7-phosphate kinase